MIKLTVCSRALAGKILHNPKYKIDFLVSIGCPDRDPPSGFHQFPRESRLKLTFFDYIAHPQDYEWVRQQSYPPTIEDVSRVITFVRNSIKPVMETQPEVLIHCEVGISRSPAIAQIVLQELGMSESLARQEVLRVRPQSVPNEFVLSLYSEYLNTPIATEYP